MRSVLLVAVVALLGACGSTQAKSTSGGGSSGSTGARCDGGGCVTSGGSGSTGGTRQECKVDGDCDVGACKNGPGGKKYCQIECSGDSDCAEGEMCNVSKGVCVVKPATTGSTGATGVGPTGGVGGTGIGSTTATPTTGSTGSHSTASTTGTTGTTGTTSTPGTTGTTAAASTSSTGSPSTASTTTTTTTGATTSGTTTGGCVAGSCPAQADGSASECDLGTGVCGPAFGSQPLDASCSGDGDCASGYCEGFGSAGSKCVSACGASGECPASFVCYYYQGSGLCLSQTFLYGGNFTVGTEGPGDACTRPNQDTTSQCHSVYFCNAAPGDDGFCTDSCGKDDECAGETCILGTSGSKRAPFCSGWSASSDTGDTCSQDSNCQHYDCRGGTCTQPCCSWWDCPSSYACKPVLGSAGEVNKICVPQANQPDGGTVGYPGDACDPHHPTTCQTGYCNAFDLFNSAATDGYCSNPCCSDADCPDQSYACRLSNNGVRFPDGGATGLMGLCFKR